MAIDPGRTISDDVLCTDLSTTASSASEAEQWEKVDDDDIEMDVDAEMDKLEAEFQTALAKIPAPSEELPMTDALYTVVSKSDDGDLAIEWLPDGSVVPLTDEELQADLDGISGTTGREIRADLKALSMAHASRATVKEKIFYCTMSCFRCEKRAFSSELLEVDITIFDESAKGALRTRQICKPCYEKDYNKNPISKSAWRRMVSETKKKSRECDLNVRDVSDLDGAFVREYWHTHLRGLHKEIKEWKTLLLMNLLRL